MALFSITDMLRSLKTSPPVANANTVTTNTIPKNGIINFISIFRN